MPSSVRILSVTKLRPGQQTLTRASTMRMRWPMVASGGTGGANHASEMGRRSCGRWRRDHRRDRGAVAGAAAVRQADALRHRDGASRLAVELDRPGHDPPVRAEHVLHKLQEVRALS